MDLANLNNAVTDRHTHAAREANETRYVAARAAAHESAWDRLHHLVTEAHGCADETVQRLALNHAVELAQRWADDTTADTYLDDHERRARARGYREAGREFLAHVRTRVPGSAAVNL